MFLKIYFNNMHIINFGFFLILVVLIYCLYFIIFVTVFYMILRFFKVVTGSFFGGMIFSKMIRNGNGLGEWYLGLWQ